MSPNFTLSPFNLVTLSFPPVALASTVRLILTPLIILGCLCSFARAELRADELALIVNKNSPESIELAEFYAKARGVPADRILALDVSDAEEITFDRYERVVVPNVRSFVNSPALRDHVKCLVTFYGVPLKIAARVNSPNEARELTALRAAQTDAVTQLSQRLAELEKLAREVDTSYEPPQTAGSPASQIVRRFERVNAFLAIAIQKLPDEPKRQSALRTVITTTQKIRDAHPLPLALDRPSTEPATTAPATQAADDVDVGKLGAEELIFRRFDPEARARLRDLASKDGLMAYARIVESQVEYLTPDATDAAFDSELALVGWPAYQRAQWQPNPLNYERIGSRTPPMLMTSRLDAPTPKIVREMIVTSVNVERTGLKGRVVVDAGGAAFLDPQKKQGAFWPFDAHFTSLANLVRERAPKLPLTYDDAPAVLRAGSVRDVALYTGWYSVGEYVPSCTFTRGAIGYHVASYEMTTLHQGTKQWCANLLKEGCVATLGPVSEPYLHAFPFPDDFFPLLMTGKLSLAESYWLTSPLVSWKICLVGDPLYTPYKVDPALQVSDLPERVRRVLGPGVSK